MPGPWRETLPCKQRPVSVLQPVLVARNKALPPLLACPPPRPPPPPPPPPPRPPSKAQAVFPFPKPEPQPEVLTLEQIATQKAEEANQCLKEFDELKERLKAELSTKEDELYQKVVAANAARDAVVAAARSRSRSPRR